MTKRNRFGRTQASWGWLAIVILVIAWPAAAGAAAPTTGFQRSEDVTAPDDESRIESPAEAARMEAYIRSLIDPRDVRMTITTEVGDVVDCVDINAQPALKLSGMENHVVQLAPTTFPMVEQNPFAATGGEPRVNEDAAAQGDVACPVGTVPIRRLTMDTMKHFRTLEDFRRKIPGHIEDPRVGATSLHQYGHAWRTVSNRGAETVLNLWSPYVERTNEFSLSQMWVYRGSGAYLETVEAGWQVYKDLYGDWRARLFIYFTPDNYGSRGCYNLTCGAFVQTNNSVYIGGPFASYSQPGGSQYVVKLLWYKDGATGNWWLRYGDTWVGYYPRSLFDSYGLRDQAAVIDFGGEIIDNTPNSRHTYTDMGSGRYPSAGFGYAAYQRSLRYVDTNNYYQNATGLTAGRTDSYCYDIALGSTTGTWGQYFYFGGPGYNANCQ